MTLLLLTCLLVLSAAFVLTRPSFIENDSIVFPDTDNDTPASVISNKFDECLRDGFKIEFKGECHELLTTTGACEDDTWLVLDYVSATLPKPVIRGKCAPRRCANKEYFWAPLNRCVNASDHAVLCPRGNVIDTDYFGEGFCECNKSVTHVRHKSGVCYPAFSKGPCVGDGVWVRVNGQGQCRKDNCTVVRGRLGDRVVVPWTDGKCYAVGDVGPCKQGDSVSVSKWAQPECSNLLATLHLLDPPCSGTDHSGQCTRPVNTPQNLFLSTVADQASRKRTKSLSNPK